MQDLPINSYYGSDPQAKAIMEVRCESQIDKSLISKIFNLSPFCFDLIKEKYANTAFVIQNGDLVLFTVKNAIVIKSLKSSITMIGGNQTKINNITSVSSDKDSKNIIIVNNHKDVLVFNQKINGNIGPIYQYKIDKTIDAESIEVDQDQNLIKIFGRDKNLIQQFPLTSGL